MPVLPTPPQEDPGTTGTAGAEYTSGRLASNDVRPSSSSSRCCLPSCFGRCKRRQAFADQLAGPTSAAVCILRSVRATAPQWGDPRRRWQRHGCDRVAIPSDMIPIGRDLTRMPISALTDMPSSVTSRSCPVAVVDVEGRDLAQLPSCVRFRNGAGGAIMAPCRTFRSRTCRTTRTLCCDSGQARHTSHCRSTCARS